MPKQTFFSDKWLEDAEFKDWIKKVDNNIHFGCKRCKKNDLSLGNMGSETLQKHAKGKKHCKAREEWIEVQNFFKKQNHASSSPQVPAEVIDVALASSTRQASPVKVQTTITEGMEGCRVRKAEIIWALTMAQKDFSNNSAMDISETFRTMFPDSQIASSFQCGADKIKYLTNWGIAPYIKDLLALEVRKSPCVVVEFDESLNKTTQECQMDIVVRFWDTECQRVKTHYWDSRFMGHSAHQDILLHFNDSIASINPAKILQVSMDGPTVNHKFYSKLVEQRKEISAPGMIDIGSCGLHIIHGAFKTVFEATGWALKSILKGAHTVLHDTPARRADYFTVTGSDQYPCFSVQQGG